MRAQVHAIPINFNLVIECNGVLLSISCEEESEFLKDFISTVIMAMVPAIYSGGATVKVYQGVINDKSTMEDCAYLC